MELPDETDTKKEWKTTMRREVSLADISDGKLYDLNDMVRADAQGCSGCSACCRGMGSSVVLDPLDLYRLARYLKTAPRQLLAGPVALGVVDGLVLPHLNMDGEGEQCPFLGQDGRCRVYEARPGICRIFPLGRFYENGSFRYFLQTRECPSRSRTKIRVRKWVDTPDLGQYESFVAQWHYFLLELQERPGMPEDVEQSRRISMELLTEFYLREYDEGIDFYEQFAQRLKAAGGKG